MREEIEQILDNDKCWENHEINGPQLNPQLAAIELEKYFANKIIEDLELLKDGLKQDYTLQDIEDKIENGINWYKQEYKL